MEQTEKTILPIFTTNYDRVLTVAVEGLGYELVDGFKNERRRRFFNPETYQNGKPKEMHLFHLHGAINWRRTKDGRIEWLTTGERVSKSSKIYSENVLIPLGSHQYPYEEPFKTCHDYLRTYLEKAKICIIVGYTFRNEPINFIFKEALKGNKNLNLIRIAPDKGVLDSIFPEATSLWENPMRFGENETLEYLWKQFGEIAVKQMKAKSAQAKEN